MKYKLTTSGCFYRDESKRKKLEKLGFSFEETSHGMKIKRDDNDVVIEISTLEELHKFIRKYGDIVMGEDSIEIYDDYRE
jgi:hypothetical protein